MRSLPEVSDRQISKCETLVKRGYYSCPGEELKDILMKRENGESLSDSDYIDIWCAFMDKIYHELPKKAFVEAVKIKYHIRGDEKQRAKEMVKLYRQFRV